MTQHRAQGGFRVGLGHRLGDQIQQPQCFRRGVDLAGFLGHDGPGLGPGLQDELRKVHALGDAVRGLHPIDHSPGCGEAESFDHSERDGKLGADFFQDGGKALAAGHFFDAPQGDVAPVGKLLVLGGLLLLAQ